jgi:hypothetical protein
MSWKRIINTCTRSIYRKNKAKLNYNSSSILLGEFKNLHFREYQCNGIRQVLGVLRMILVHLSRMIRVANQYCLDSALYGICHCRRENYPDHKADPAIVWRKIKYSIQLLV